jgi:glucose/arabinose dehydrogenase
VRRALAAGAGVLAACCVAAGAGAQGEAAPEAKRGFAVQREEVADNLAQPMYTAFAPGVPDTAYVVLRQGTVEAVDPADGSRQEFLDIAGRVSTAGEGGLLSIAFDPGYQTNGRFYAYYTSDGSHKIHIDEFEAISDADADEASRRSVMSIPHPGQENHLGGTIAFGEDGFLYAATGDGGGSGDPKENAQDKGVLLGKLLRINPRGPGDGDYSTPNSNPFKGRPGRNEIYAMGLRNPFRWSFDPPTGRIAIGDVGQSSWEEVDIESRRSLRAANFGWDHYEGDHRYDGGGDEEAPRPPASRYEPPVHEYPHSQGNVITGGVVVRDPSLPDLDGRYLYADYGNDQLRSFRVRLSGARGDRPLGIAVTNPSSFANGPDGTVYITSLSGGELYRLAPQP